MWRSTLAADDAGWWGTQRVADDEGQEQKQKKKQIPCGNDKQNGKNRNESISMGKSWRVWQELERMREGKRADRRSEL